MEFIQELIDDGKFPILAALLLGLFTAISPCPLATNITAIGYISKDVNSRAIAFANGLLYALGRIVVYSVLGIILIFLIGRGVDIYGIEKFAGKWGAYLLPTFLIAAGLLILFSNKLNFISLGTGKKLLSRIGSGLCGAFLMGIVFAMAFCPSSGLFYFGILIPMSAENSSVGYILPSIFALASSLPILIMSCFFAFSIGKIGEAYASMVSFEFYFRQFAETLFVIVGTYYIF